MANHPVRAIVWSTGSTWHYIVYVRGVVVLYDNTGDREIIMRTAQAHVHTLRSLHTAGHKLKLKSYKGSRSAPLHALYDQTQARRRPKSIPPRRYDRGSGIYAIAA